MNTLRIATRKSPLALWQANEVKSLLLNRHQNLQVELLEFSTQGDRRLDTSLSKIGGKGLFVKELEHALFENHADIAVHSMKDVPMQLPDGLCLPVILQRDDPRDAFVSNQFANLASLPAGACVGTSSLRRKMQLCAAYPTLVVHDLRGNVGTRLSKLDNGDYDAIILAVAGLKRLSLSNRIRDYLDVERSLPAIGQGAIGIECREQDEQIIEWIKPLAHLQTSRCIHAERALNQQLGGGCHFPIAGYAEYLGADQIKLCAKIGSPNGDTIIANQMIMPELDAEKLGIDLAKRLIKQGGRDLLDQFRASMDHGLR